MPTVKALRGMGLIEDNERKTDVRFTLLGAAVARALHRYWQPRNTNGQVPDDYGPVELTIVAAVVPRQVADA